MAAKARLNKGTAELLVAVTAESAVWKEEQQKAFKSLAANLVIKGFRKGQVPVELARKSIRQDEVFTTAIRKMLDILVREASDEIDEKQLVLDSPTYRVTAVTDAQLEVTFVYPVYPEVELGAYKGLVVDYEEKPTSEESVEAELSKILQSRGKLAPKSGELAKGDTAIFDFKGYVDGELFDGGSAEDFELEIGSNQFIAGFEDQMIGMKPGEERHVAVRFPANYGAEDLRNKDAIFIVNLKSAKGRVKPSLDDEFVVSLNIPGAKTVVEFREYIKRVFTQQTEQQARSVFQREAFEKIRATLKAPLAPSLVQRESHRIEEQFEGDLKKQGLDMKKYEQISGLTHDQLHEQFNRTAIARLQDSLIFAEISKLEKLEVTDVDYEAAYLKYAALQNQSVDAVKAIVTKAQLQIPLTNDKVIDFLIAHRAPSQPVVAPKEEKAATKSRTTTKAAKPEATKSVQAATTKEVKVEATKVVKPAATEVTKSVKTESTKAVETASEGTKSMKYDPSKVTKVVTDTAKEGTKVVKTEATKVVSVATEATKSLKANPAEALKNAKAEATKVVASATEATKAVKAEATKAVKSVTEAVKSTSSEATKAVKTEATKAVKAVEDSPAGSLLRGLKDDNKKG